MRSCHKMAEVQFVLRDPGFLRRSFLAFGQVAVVRNGIKPFAIRYNPFEPAFLTDSCFHNFFLLMVTE